MNLLFSHADDGDPYLTDSPDPGTAAAVVQGKVYVKRETHLADLAASADDLERQRWAVMAPAGPGGDRLLALVQPLIAKRADDQEAPVMTLRVPPGMSAAEAFAWKRDVYPRLYGATERRRPRYILILGDMDGVSLPTQQVLAIDGFPGRLVCPSERGYEAYVDKVLRWELRPSTERSARALFYTVHDGTDATRSGYDGLVKPCYSLCEREAREDPRRFPAQVLDHGSRQRPDADELLDLAENPAPSVLFSMSHGMGPPRRRDWSHAEARELQGAMHFGAGEDPLVPSEITECAFLPGGLWFYFACFGAGTPSESAYRHWLRMLAERGGQGVGDVDAVLRSLSVGGGFTSGLAQAALANPNGPLAVVGHIDLAWSYGFEELTIDGGGGVRGTSQVDNFFQLVQHLVARDKHSGVPGRLGAAMLKLMLPLGRVSQELNSRYDEYAKRGVAVEGEAGDTRQALGHLWMLRQDLMGYALLGDPAVRLPLAAEQRRRALRSRRAGADSDGTAATRPSRAQRRANFAAGVRAGRAVGADGAADSADAALGSGDDERVQALETAILARAAGQRSYDDVARAFGRGRAQAKRWEAAYREAGRQALARLLQNPDGDPE